MKTQLYFVVLAGVLCLASSQDNVYELIQRYNFSDEASRADLLAALQSDRIARTIDCLINPSDPTCDSRIANLRTVIKAVADNDYKCASCPLQMKFFIAYVKEAIRQDKTQCLKAVSGLQLRDPGC